MANNVLTTGGNGFLGKIVTESLLFNENTVIDIQDISNSRIDISNRFDIATRTPIDIVVHMAGMAHMVPKSKVEERVFFDVNLEGTKNLCSALIRAKQTPSLFIFISSVAVYGLDQGNLIDELSPLLGVTPYAKSKILAESYLFEWAEKNGIKLFAFRLPLLAGKNPPGNLGNMIKSIKSSKYLSIGKAKSKKSVLWAQDVGNLIHNLIVSEKPGGVYNLTDGYHPMVAELENSISKGLHKGKPMRIPYILAKCIALCGDLFGKLVPINSSRLRKLTSTLTFDDSKAKTQLGWSPRRVLDNINGIL